MNESIKYIVSLSKKHTNALAFIPHPRLEEDFNKGQIWLQKENNDPCGFLHFTRGYPNLHITNACIQIDAQHRGHALNLVKQLIVKADREGYESISLWCASDLEANDFWKACGFVFIKSVPGGRARGRLKNLYVFWLPNPKQQRLFVA